MQVCKGNGACFKRCACSCYDPITDVDNDVCTCGCRAHSVEYCRAAPCTHDCKLVQCKNFGVCGIQAPKWQFDLFPEGHNRLCFDCWAYRGVLKQTEEVELCTICFETKQLVVLSCHASHKLCLTCWDTTINSRATVLDPSSCPLCRKVIGGMTRKYWSGEQ